LIAKKSRTCKLLHNRAKSARGKSGNRVDLIDPIDGEGIRALPRSVNRVKPVNAVNAVISQPSRECVVKQDIVDLPDRSTLLGAIAPIRRQAYRDGLSMSRFFRRRLRLACRTHHALQSPSPA
jgi:hypothetical protein